MSPSWLAGGTGGPGNQLVDLHPHANLGGRQREEEKRGPKHSASWESRLASPVRSAFGPGAGVRFLAARSELGCLPAPRGCSEVLPRGVLRAPLRPAGAAKEQVRAPPWPTKSAGPGAPVAAGSFCCGAARSRRQSRPAARGRPREAGLVLSAGAVVRACTKVPPKDPAIRVGALSTRPLDRLGLSGGGANQWHTCARARRPAAWGTQVSCPHCSKELAVVLSLNQETPPQTF